MNTMAPKSIQEYNAATIPPTVWSLYKRQAQLVSAAKISTLWQGVRSFKTLADINKVLQPLPSQ